MDLEENARRDGIHELLGVLCASAVLFFGARSSRFVGSTQDDIALGGKAVVAVGVVGEFVVIRLMQ